MSPADLRAKLRIDAKKLTGRLSHLKKLGKVVLEDDGKKTGWSRV